MFLIIYINKQGQKRQTNKIQKKKLLKDKFKSSVCNGQVSQVNSNTIDNLKDALYKNGISCDNNYECLHQDISKIDKRALQNKSIRTNDFIADLKYITNYQQIIKPCFVKLNACAVQNYISNRENIAKSNQDILHNAKFLHTDTLQNVKDVSETQNIISRSVSTESNDFGNFNHMSVKQCSVILHDNIVKDWNILKSKRNMKNIINIKDKSNISHLVSHNSSKNILNCNKNIVLASYKTKKRKHLIKNSYVKVEKLKIGKFVKKNDTIAEKEQNIVSSTPIGKRIKSSSKVPLVIFSPINSNICDKLHLNQEYSLVIAKKDVSNIDRKNSCSLISECYKLNSADIQKQTQVLLSQKAEMSTDIAIKNEITSYKDNNVVTTQKYETECNIETEIPYSVNMSIVSTNQSRSLFDDIIYNHSKDIDKNNIEEKYFSDASKFLKINTVNSSVNLEQKQLLSDEQADTSSQYISPSKVCERDLDNAMHTRQKYDNEFQENYDTRINAVETIHENLKDKTTNINKHNILNENQDNINIIDTRVLLTRLQDSVRVGRRIQYPKWHLDMSNISNILNNETTQSNNEISRIATDKDFLNVQSVYNFEYSKNVINSSLDHSESFNGTTQYNSSNQQIEKSIFLKPGKYWARSLSILSNINDGSDLDKLSIGKGKKWRHSVRDILDMQKRGNFYIR